MKKNTIILVVCIFLLGVGAGLLWHFEWKKSYESNHNTQETDKVEEPTNKENSSEKQNENVNESENINESDMLEKFRIEIENSKPATIKSNSQISEETKKELLDIMLIDKEKNSNTEGSHTIANLSLISNESIKTKQNIIRIYALRHKSIEDLVENKDEGCKNKAGYCLKVSKDDYNYIAKKYNIKESFDDLYSDIDEYFMDKNNDSVFYYGDGTTITGMDTHDLTAKYDGDNIIVIDALKRSYTNSKIENKKVKYTFNKIDTGYALYSIESN